MKKAIIILLLITFFLTGCDAGYSRTSAGASGFDGALSVIQVGVPYIGAMDLRLDAIKLLETDNYGRNLFIYEMGLSPISALLIVQKTEEPFVYYYEDHCYMIQESGPDNFSAHDIDVIKSNNDWNKPLDEDRMMAINYKDIRPDCENIDSYFDVCKLIQEDLEHRHPEKSWKSVNISLNGLESYAGCGQVILVEIHYSGSNTVEYYVALYSPNHDDPVREVEPIDEICNFKEHIKIFKDTYCKLNSA